MSSDDSQFSAPEPALGYFYQPRYALLQLLRLPEETVCFIEKDDDIDFTDAQEGRVLASLKHKAPGDTLTDLSPDFWKSVRIWLDYYLKKGSSTPSLSFFLFTTGSVAIGSFMEAFLPNARRDEAIAKRVSEVLAQSESKKIQKTKDLLEKLPKDKWPDFFRRITVFDNQDRIQDIPQLIIDEKLRTVRPQFRRPVYERLEGWWNNECIELLSGRRREPLRGSEVSEMLSFITEQFREDNLPIDFEHSEPEGGVHPDSDDRYFVKQLRAVGLRSDRLRRSILDYYRAFEQRGSWLRENVTLSGELELYDDRLIDEWARLREIVFEELSDDSPEELLQKTGRELLNKLSTSDHPNLRIRTGVTATFVTMGSYHMLANDEAPRVHWHPRFQERIGQILHGRQP
ncbi:MAG: ABC-three component system protein [Thermodesulfovibrionales bacterium]